MALPIYTDIPELSPEASAIARRRKIAEAMLAQSQEQMPTNQMAGQVVAPVSWTQGLAKLAQAYVGNKQAEDADKAEQGLANKRQQMVADELAKLQGMAQGSAGVEGVEAQPERTIQAPAPMQPNQVAPNYNTVPETVPAVAGKAAVPAVAPNKRQAIMDAMMSNLPEVQKYGTALLGFEEMDSKSADAKLARKEKFDNDRALALEKIDEQFQNKMISQTQAESLKMAIANMQDDSKRDLVTLAAALRPAPAEKAPLQITDEAGNVKLVDYQGNVIKDLGKVGKPTGAYAKDANKLQQATEQDKAAALKALKAAGYDPTTGEDAISDLIKGSTSGFFQKQGANAAAAFDVTTEGRKKLNTLESAANTIVMQMMGGKLGSGISNADRDFVMGQLGDVANADKTSEERLAAWRYAKARMVGVGMLPEESKAKPSGAPASGGGADIDKRLEKYK